MVYAWNSGVLQVNGLCGLTAFVPMRQSGRTSSYYCYYYYPCAPY